MFVVVIVVVYVVFVVIIVLDVVVWVTLKVYLRLLVMEVEFGLVGLVLGGCCDGWVWGVWVLEWWCANPFLCQTQLSWVKLRLC